MSISMLRVRWLFFDLGNTIWRSSTPESRRAAGLYPKVGGRMREWLEARGHLCPTDAALVAERVWDAVDAAAQGYPAMQVFSDTLAAEELGAAVQRALGSLGVSISPEEGRQLWQLANATAPERGITLLDGAASTVQALSDTGLRLGIITNRTYGEALTRRDLAAFGLDGLFQQVILSSDVGYRKPHPRIFKAALEEAGARAQECALVGDDPRADVQGAQDAGLRAIWLRSPRTGSDRPVTPDATIDQLAELLDLVTPAPS